jgi:hypothetical protein
METTAKLLLGGALGAAAGLGIARARLCSSEACRTKANFWFSILAGTLAGLSVTWWIMQRG